MRESPTPGADERPLILVVDDTPVNLTLMAELLSEHYRVKVAANGPRALRIAQALPPPDLILLDVMMPGMGGLEVCEQLKANPHTRDIPVLFLTAKSQPEDEEAGFKVGAQDYITKPFSPPTVLARVATHLALRRAHQALRDKAQHLEREVSRRNMHALQVQDAVLQTLAGLALLRSHHRASHASRMEAFVRLLGQHLQRLPRWSGELGGARLDLLLRACTLHDLGHVALPDALFQHLGRYSASQRRHMQTHAHLGRDLLLDTQSRVGQPVPVLELAAQIAASHHEHWDGQGYPDGLAGDAIPAAARLTAVADCYDALVHDRPWRRAMDHAAALEHIQAERGRQFDPDVVDALLAQADALGELSQRLSSPTGGGSSVVQWGVALV